MVDKIHIENLIQQFIEAHPDKEFFLVETSISKNNEIKIFIDSYQTVSIDDCVTLSRFIESNTDRETEDFELTVSSAGLDLPLMIEPQFKKHLGQNLEVLHKDGIKIKGKLIDFDSQSFTLEVEKKVKIPGKKKKQNITEQQKIAYSESKQTKILVTF